MLRILMACLLTAMLTACGYASDVDLAPQAERIPKRVVSTGDYCEAMARPPYTIKSSADCIRLAWNQQARSYAMIDPDEEDEPVVAAVAPVGRNLYLAQVDDADDVAGGRYKVSLMLAKGGAFLALPPLERERFVVLAARHPGVTLRYDAADPVIVGGSRPDIKAFLRASAVEALRSVNLEEEDLSVGVRDRSGAPDHSASAAQVRDIVDLVITLRRLQAGD